MHYFVDGYNLLFRLAKSYKKLKSHERDFLLLLNEWAEEFHFDLTLVFDGKEEERWGAAHSHLGGIELIYTPRNQTADEYILKEIEASRAPHQETVISSDRELIGRAKQRGAQVQTIEEFLSLLQNRKQKRQKRKASSSVEFKETERELKRLKEIFEARLKRGSDS